MDQQFDLLRHVAQTFERLGVRYFVTGSFATIYYGEYRATNDIDIVSTLEAKDAAAFAQAFPLPNFYVDVDTIRDAIAHHFQFNILHVPTGLKIDVIIPANTPFDQSRLSRIHRLSPAPGMEAWFAAPEDVILKKLVFHLEGGSDKHLRDIAGVLRISGESLDRVYIEKWARDLGVSHLWQEVLNRVAKSP